MNGRRLVRKVVFVTGLFASMLTVSANGRCATRIDLNDDWQFRADPAKAGTQEGWPNAAPVEADVVQLPHTWNSGKYYRYEGDGWYFKRFKLDPGLRNRRIEIHFGATFYKARVWLNGHPLGEHEGGFTEYFFDATSYMQDENLLVLQINNEPRLDSIPGIPQKVGPEATIYDWWPYGGITRGVWLTVSGSLRLRNQKIDAIPVNGGAQITDRVTLENHTAKKEEVILRLAVHDLGRNTEDASAEKRLTLSPGTQTVSCSFSMAKALLWDFDHTKLYRMEATVRSTDAHDSDFLDDNFGIRTIEIRERHLYLNGKRVRLSGVSRHEDSPWEGTAETRGTILYDYNDLKNLQTTLARPVHYPQNPLIYDYADRNGILMIPEIPMWQFGEEQMKNPKVISLAREEMRELIDQNYNHPAIFAWSVDNESATNTPGGIAYFQQMYAFVKQLNPARYVTFADDMIAFVDDPATNASSLADFVMWNEYFGSWDGPESLLPSAFDKIEKGYPNKMVIISEFGTPGIYATNTEAADLLRTRIIHQQMREFASRDWIGGVLFWCYQDYHSSHNLRPGQDDDYVDHGLVDKNRQRRPSYYAWRDENAPAHIEAQWRYDSKGVPVGFTAEIRRRPPGELPSYDLVNYRADWVIYDQTGKKVAGSTEQVSSSPAAAIVSGELIAGSAKMLRLEIRLYRPTGFLAVGERLTWKMPDQGLDDGEAPSGTIETSP